MGSALQDLGGCSPALSWIKPHADLGSLSWALMQATSSQLTEF